MSQFDNALKLTVLGCGLSFPSAGGASSGYLIRAGSTAVLVDCGHGVAGKLPLAAELSSLSAIVLSHMHPDHFFDLVPLRYAFFFQGVSPIPMYVPPNGYEMLERLQEAVGLDPDFFKSCFHVAEYDAHKILKSGNLSFQFAPTRHFLEGYGMRVSTAGQEDAARKPGATGNPERGGEGVPTLLYTSDTGWSQEIIDLGRGSTLALIEASVLEFQTEQQSQGHLTGQLAGKMARDADIQRLLLTHYWEPMGERLLEQARAEFPGPAELAKGLVTYTV